MRLRRTDLEWREVEGQVVLVDLAGGTYVAVNRSGAALWPLLAEGTTREALVARLRERYGLAADVAERDLDAFLVVLRGHGLLEDRRR